MASAVAELDDESMGLAVEAEAWIDVKHHTRPQLQLVFVCSPIEQNGCGCVLARQPHQTNKRSHDNLRLFLVKKCRYVHGQPSHCCTTLALIWLSIVRVLQGDDFAAKFDDGTSCGSPNTWAMISC